MGVDRSSFQKWQIRQWCGEMVLMGGGGGGGGWGGGAMVLMGGVGMANGIFLGDEKHVTLSTKSH